MATIFNFLLDILMSTVGFFFKLIGGFIIGALTLKEPGSGEAGQTFMPKGMLGNFFNLFIPAGTQGATQSADVPFLKIIITIGLLLMFVLYLVNLIRIITASGDRMMDNPFVMTLKMLVLGTVIPFSYTLVDLMVSVAAIFYNIFSYDSLKTLGEVKETNLQGDANADGATNMIAGLTAAGGEVAGSLVASVGATGGIILGFFLLFLLFSLLTSWVKYILEFFERYVLLGVICLFAPIMFACLISNNTVKYFWSWFQMLFSQLIIIVMSTLFLGVFYSAMTRYDLIRNPLVFVFLLMAWLRVGTRIDAHMSTLGLTTAQAGGMAGDIISGGYMANKLGEWMMPRGLNGERQTFTKAIANELENGVFGRKNGNLAADTTGRRSTFAAKYQGKQLDKAKKKGENFNHKGVSTEAIGLAKRKQKSISNIADPMKKHLGMENMDFEATNGGVNGKDGSVWLSGKNEDGSEFLLKAKELQDGEVPEQGKYVFTAQDGTTYQGEVQGDGADQFLSNSRIQDGSESSQDIINAFGGESNVDIETKSGGVAENITGQDILEGKAGDGSFVVTDSNGNRHEVDKNTQFGEMVNGGFVAAGDTFTSKDGTVPMMLKEDDDGYYQSFTEEKEHTVTAQANGFIDKNGNFVSMSKEEFSNAHAMTAGNAQNVHSLIKDESGHFQKLSGGTLHTNEKGQVGVVGANGKETFVTPHESAVNRDASGKITSYNTANAFVQGGDQDFQSRVQKTWNPVAETTTSTISKEAGVRIGNGSIAQLSPSGISDNNELMRFTRDGVESSKGQYVKTLGAKGETQLSRLDASEKGGRFYTPTYSIASGLQTDERGRFDVSKIRSAQKTSSGLVTSFENGQVMAAHSVVGNRPTDRDSYYSNEAMGSIHSRNERYMNSYAENLSPLGGLSKLQTFQREDTMDKRAVTIAREADKQFILDGMSSHGMFTNGNTQNIKAMHINPDTGVLGVREHNQSEFLFFPKSSYSKPDNASSSVSIAGSDYYVVNSKPAQNKQMRDIAFAQEKLYSQLSLDGDVKTIEWMKNNEALVFSSDFVGRGGKGSAYDEALKSVGDREAYNRIHRAIENLGLQIPAEERRQFNYNLSSAYNLEGDFDRSISQFDRFRKKVASSLSESYDRGTRYKDIRKQPITRTSINRFMKED